MFLCLIEVFKALEPDDWDNDSLDELFAAADKNGDGALSVKEFLTLADMVGSREGYSKRC